MAYKQQIWTDYDDRLTETQNIENGAVVTKERMNNLENGVVLNHNLLNTEQQFIQEKINNLEINLSNTKKGLIDFFNSAKELEQRFPKGQQGYAVVYKSVNGKRIGYIYVWRNNSWFDTKEVFSNDGIDENYIETKMLKNKSVTPEKISEYSDLKDVSTLNRGYFLTGTTDDSKPFLIKDDTLSVIRIKIPEKGMFDIPYPGENVLTKGQFILVTDSNDTRTYMRACRAVLDVDRKGWQIITEGDLQKIRINTKEIPENDVFIYLTYPLAYAEKVSFKATGNYSLSDFKFLEDELPENMINNKVIQDKLAQRVDVYPTSKRFLNKYISGYKINSDYTIDMLNSETNDVVEILYPKERTGVIRFYYKYAGIGQQVFIADSNGKYIWQSNITNFPNIKRDGWTVRDELEYFEINLSEVAAEESIIYLSVLKEYSKNYYALVDGSTYLKSNLIKSETDSNRVKEIDLLLPNFYPIVAGDTGYIYFDQTLTGSLTRSCYLNTPMWSSKNNTSSASTVIKVNSDDTREIYAQLKNEVINRSTRIVSVPKNAGSNKRKKVLIIGESTTDTSKSLDYIPELKRRFDADSMNIELLGSRGEGEFKHEGRSGWGVGALRYLASRGEVQNPFYNTVKDDFDFGYFRANYPDSASPDYVIIRFGINEPNRFVEHKTDKTFVEHYNFLMEDIRKYLPNVKFILEVTMSMARFPSVITHASRFEIMKRNKELLETYQGRESEGIFVSNAYLNIDPINDYPSKEIPIDIYNEKTEVEVIDATHPSKSGQQKQADVTYWMLKYIAWKEEI